MVSANILGLSLVFGIVAVFFLGVWATSGSNESSDGIIIPTPDAPPAQGPVQDVYVKATAAGSYNPQRLTVRQNVPVNLHFSADNGAGCGRTLVIPSFKIWTVAPSTGEKVVRFTPTKTGTVDFHCSMNMFRGKIEVIP